MTTAPWGITRMGPYPESSPIPALTPVIDPETQVAGFVDEHTANLDEFRLVYGAFDFAITTRGDWYFLECNPNGQWAWQPAETTAAIARAIADQLERGPDS
ncbi:hypothetical protein GCM10018790_31110 [Kitasatospora xanthocidica]|uniref:putative ATP-grasp-modified RiPP n=1 Tax=Kitasatospora xanthocidica TaxID=83382 RepID=UPI001673CEB0|nr:hypothetical protein GCM10018790_31110 [Kitasatospora xanthocidica]